MALSKSFSQLSKTEKNYLLLQQKLTYDAFHVANLSKKQKKILEREVGGKLPQSPLLQTIMKNS
jgi:hypothetical protein